MNQFQLKPDIIEDDLYDIVQYFCMYPGRAKARNNSIYIYTKIMMVVMMKNRPNSRHTFERTSVR